MKLIKDVVIVLATMWALTWLAVNTLPSDPMTLETWWGFPMCITYICILGAVVMWRVEK